MLIFYFFGSLGGGRFFGFWGFFFTYFTERIAGKKSLGRRDHFDIVEAFVIAYLSSAIWSDFFFLFLGDKEPQHFTMQLPLLPTSWLLLLMLPSLTTAATPATPATPATTASPSPKPRFYSNTWAGAAQVRQNNTSPFSSIEGTLILPRLSLPSNPQKTVDQYSFSYWIGLDGYQSPGGSGLWQAGVVGHIFPHNNTRQYVGFWEWIPDPYEFVTAEDDFPVLEGDHVFVKLNVSTNGTVATVRMENRNSSKSIEHTRSAPTKWRGPSYSIPGTSAEWIAESGTYENYTKQVLPDFGTVEFYDARAFRRDGTVVRAGDARTNGLQMFENFWVDSEMLYSNAEVVEGETGVRVEYVEEKCEECAVQCLAAGTCLNTTTSTGS